MQIVKYSAYTILELIIVMLITSIVVAITYMGFNLLHRNYLSYQIAQRKIIDQIMLDKVMTQDFSNGEIIFKTPYGISFQSTDRNVNYFFEKDQVIRKQGARSDTISIHISDVHILFLNKKSDAIIDELIFNDGKKDNQYHYRKRYSSDQIIKMSTSHE